MPLTDEFIRHRVYVGRYSGSLVAEALTVLEKALEQITARIATRAPTSEDLARLRALEADVRAIMDAAAGRISAKLDSALPDYADYEAQFAVGRLQAAATVQIAAVSPDLVFSTVMDRVFELAESGQKMTLTQAVRSFAAGAARDVTATIQAGVVAGRTTPQIVADVRALVGSRTKAQADALVRTMTAHIGDEARAGVYAANAGILKGEKYIATLDLRTTQGCAALHGQVFPVGQGPRTPRHWHCRSIRVPWLDDRYRLATLDQRVPAVGANGPGQVSSRLTFGGWLKTQPVEFQKEFFRKFPDGAEKYKLFSAGRLPLDRFVDAKGAAYTLDELTRLNPANARAAGLS